MQAFKDGQVGLLVATTVIEVGVDVPNASLMIIENAERLGLSQLHQLRGRVGRGTAASGCLLLYKWPLGGIAESRIATLCGTEDGFLIAEKDLELRGEGEVVGTRQSGLPNFRIADLAVHGGLLTAAREDAAGIVKDDPQLASPRGQALRVLLHLFEKNEAVRLLL